MNIGQCEGISNDRNIRIEQIQIEQDSGKTLKIENHNLSWIDLNRAGAAVLEIVTQPDLRSALESVTFLKKVQRLLSYNLVCSPDMDEGAFRSDVNISVRKVGDPLGTKVELKHIVKFSSISAAIGIRISNLDFEVKRQTDVLTNGGRVQQETRGYDADKGITFRIRRKEDVEDYNYMPDPDVPPLVLDAHYIDQVKSGMPENYDDLRKRLSSYRISNIQLEKLLSEPLAAHMLDSIVNSTSKPLDQEKVANWITGDIFGWLNLNGLKIDQIGTPAAYIGQLIELVIEKKVSGLQAKKVLIMMLENANCAPPWDIIVQNEWVQENDQKILLDACNQVVIMHPEIVEKVRSGKKRMLGFLVGEVMKLTNSQADPVQVSKILKSKI